MGPERIASSVNRRGWTRTGGPRSRGRSRCSAPAPTSVRSPPWSEPTVNARRRSSTASPPPRSSAPLEHRFLHPLLGAAVHEEIPAGTRAACRARGQLVPTRRRARGGRRASAARRPGGLARRARGARRAATAASERGPRQRRDLSAAGARRGERPAPGGELLNGLGSARWSCGTPPRLPTSARRRR